MRGGISGREILREIEIEETNDKIKIPLSALKLLGDILMAMGMAIKRRSV